MKNMASMGKDSGFLHDKMAAVEDFSRKTTPLIAFSPVLESIEKIRKNPKLSQEGREAADALFVGFAGRMLDLIESFPKDRPEVLTKHGDLSRFVGVYNYLRLFEESLRHVPAGGRQDEVALLGEIYEAWVFHDHSRDNFWHATSCSNHFDGLRNEEGSSGIPFAKSALAEAVSCAFRPQPQSRPRRLGLFTLK